MVRQIIRVTAALLPFAVMALAAKLDCNAQPQALIEDVNVVDVVTGTVKARQDVLIAGGRIAAIADHGAIPRPDAHSRIYAGGQYLLPGFWDASVHLRHAEDQLGLYLAHGVTGLRDMDAENAAFGKWQAQAARDNALVPRIVTDSPAEDNSAWKIPMLSKLRRGLLPDTEEALHNPAFQLVSVDVWQSWASAPKRASAVAPGTREVRRAAYDSAAQATRKMARDGFAIVAGSDTGDPYTVPGDELHRELELLVQAGLSPGAALRAATIEPARMLQLQSGFGTVEAGKAADLVLLEANPLVDIRNTRSVCGVFLGGRYLNRQQLDQLIAAPVTFATN